MKTIAQVLERIDETKKDILDIVADNKRMETKLNAEIDNAHSIDFIADKIEGYKRRVNRNEDARLFLISELKILEWMLED